MKTLLLTILLAFTVLATNAQNSKISFIGSGDTTSTVYASGSRVSLIVNSNRLDTTVCYFREITGIKNNNLIGRWVKGFIVKPVGNTYFYNDSRYSYYLYSNKRKVLNKVIQYY